MRHWYSLRALPQHNDADHYDNENSDAGDGNEEAGSLSEIRRLHFPHPHVILQNRQVFHLCENIIGFLKYFGFFLKFWLQLLPPAGQRSCEKEMLLAVCICQSVDWGRGVPM